MDANVHPVSEYAQVSDGVGGVCEQIRTQMPICLSAWPFLALVASLPWLGCRGGLLADLCDTIDGEDASRLGGETERSRLWMLPL